MDTKNRPTILCVDDEPTLLEGLSLHLERRYNLLTAGSGVEGLAILEREREIAVVISDMRMPRMDGAAFLSKAREMLPESVRILLTGQADLDSAIAAVNEGQIFRFLTKPCPPPTLMSAVEAAVKQHQLITAERVLLEKTLHGSVKALSDTLGLTSPALFGRAARIKKRVTELASALGIRDRWQVEVAAMMSQLGAIVLPPDAAERIYSGRELSEADQRMVARVPGFTEQILENIPRLETVRGMLRALMKPRRLDAPQTPDDALIAQGAEMLRIVSDFDVLETRGTPPEVAAGTLRARAERYDAGMLAAFANVLAAEERLQGRTQVRDLSLSALKVGMIFAEDVVLSAGALLVARGYEITPSFIERATNFPRGAIKEPLRVVVPF